jgi:hypothetical protein
MPPQWRIKKFRLAEAFALVFLATAGVIAFASDVVRARRGDIPPSLGLEPVGSPIVVILLLVTAICAIRKVA